MKPKMLAIIGIALALLLVTGVVVYNALFSASPTTSLLTDDENLIVNLPPVDPSITITLTESTTKANTVVIDITNLKSKMVSVGYELTYSSEGLIKGVNSGSKPLDLAGKDAFQREIYLGTCSKNVCKPDSGVTSVTLTLEFTDTASQKSQFSQEYPL